MRSAHLGDVRLQLKGDDKAIRTADDETTLGEESVLLIIVSLIDVSNFHIAQVPTGANIILAVNCITWGTWPNIDVYICT